MSSSGQFGHGVDLDTVDYHRLRASVAAGTTSHVRPLSGREVVQDLAAGAAVGDHLVPALASPLVVLPDHTRSPAIVTPVWSAGRTPWCRWPWSLWSGDPGLKGEGLAVVLGGVSDVAVASPRSGQGAAGARKPAADRIANDRSVAPVLEMVRSRVVVVLEIGVHGNRSGQSDHRRFDPVPARVTTTSGSLAALLARVVCRYARRRGGREETG